MIMMEFDLYLVSACRVVASYGSVVLLLLVFQKRNGHSVQKHVEQNRWYPISLLKNRERLQKQIREEHVQV